MMQKKRTLQGIAVCAMVLLLAFGGMGCSGNESDTESGVNVAMEDLAYGSTMRDDDSHAVPLEYDKRFFENADELDALANYYAAIQNQDAELLQTCTVREYMDYLYENVYGGLLDDRAFVAQQHEKLGEEIDGTYTISQVQITGCLDQDDAGSEASRLTEMLNTLKGDENYCTDHMQSCKTLTLTLVLSNDTDTVFCDEITVYLLCLDDAYYVCA